MLRVLLVKDLRRAWRNPLPWLINLIVPLVLTALIGFVFGGSSENNALGRIRFAVVDEDGSLLANLLRGAVNQSKGGEYLEPVFMARDDALKLVNAGKISAVVIIETNFTRDYLTGRKPVSLHLIKNPAESIHPVVVEELLGVAATGLNALSRNFHSDFPEWQAVIDGGVDYRKVSELINRTGDKLNSAKEYVGLVRYEGETPGSETSAPGTNSNAGQGGETHPAGSAATKHTSQMSEVFSYLLLGMSAMFLLFLGQNAMTDLHRELRKRTFERYQTMHQQLWPFILGKILFAVVMLLICSAIMIGGGGLAFGIHWENPLPLLALVAAYGCFVAALFAALVAIVPDERRAGVLNNLAGMALGIVGGCAFPPRMLPAFLRDHVTPLMPSYWFTDAARNLQSADGAILWGMTFFRLLLCAVVLAGISAWLFRQKFKSGLRT